MRSRELIALMQRLSDSKRQAVRWIMLQAKDWSWNDNQCEKLGLELGKLLLPIRLRDYAADHVLLQVHFGEPTGVLKEACEAACVYPLGETLCFALYIYRDKHQLRTPVFGEGTRDKMEECWTAPERPVKESAAPTAEDKSSTPASSKPGGDPSIPPTGCLLPIVPIMLDDKPDEYDELILHTVGKTT